MRRDVPAAVTSLALSVPTADAMQRLGERLAGLLHAGDLVLLTGDLGAGKTTLTQGIGAGLQVRGDVTSPTFVIAREHRSTSGGPDLVHVDAYRLGSLAEVDDLDLDASTAGSVTVVEWGSGLVEELVESRLELRLARGHDADDETRGVEVTGYGPRWAGVPLTELVDGADPTEPERG